MTTAYSGYGIPTPDFTDLNRTAHRIRYNHNMYKSNCHFRVCHFRVFCPKLDTRIQVECVHLKVKYIIFYYICYAF
jgi:hypothetical protein